MSQKLTDVKEPNARIVKDKCQGCGKTLYDEGVASDVIYRVSDDVYFCDDICEARK